jgi:hypothetical protein
MLEIAIFTAIAGVGGFVGGVLGSNKVHAAESRLRAEVAALETRLRAAIDSLKK